MDVTMFPWLGLIANITVMVGRLQGLVSPKAEMEQW